MFYLANQVRYNLERVQYLWLSYYIIVINKCILDFIYLMPWKSICILRFHEFLQTTILRQITKENEEIDKLSQKPLQLCTNLYGCLWVCVWGVIVVYYCVRTYNWCEVYVCEKIHTQRDKLEVVSRIEGSRVCYRTVEKKNL